MVRLIAKQVETAVEGARLAESMAAGEISACEARGLMSVLEHRGDDQRAELVLALAHSLTAPIDREDLFRLSRSVDDVLDDLRDFVRESDLYAIDDQEGVAPLLASIADGLQEMGVAVQNVVASSRTVTADALLVKKHCNRVRQLYQLQLAGLFTGEVTVDMFKRRELLRRIDVVGLRMGEAADALLDGVLKRRH